MVTTRGHAQATGRGDALLLTMGASPPPQGGGVVELLASPSRSEAWKCRMTVLIVVTLTHQAQKNMEDAYKKNGVNP